MLRILLALAILALCMIIIALIWDANDTLWSRALYFLLYLAAEMAEVMTT